MKLIWAICILTVLECILLSQAIDIPDHLKEQAKKLHKLCQKETGVAEEIIQQSTTHGKISNDRKLQCYFHCVFDKVGLVDEKNMVHLEYMLEVLPVEQHAFIQKLVDVCGTKPGADGCETVLNTVKCYIESEPDKILNKFSFLFE